MDFLIGEDYEKERQRRIAENKALLARLNIQHGRRIQGGRIYDSELGTTCHQCRQKTIEEKIRCTNELEEGQMCRVMLDERCLVGRYGENLEEARRTGEWICPKCRDICNCSFCRRKKGLQPTGLLKSIALRKGFKSVRHFLGDGLKFDKKIVIDDETNLKIEDADNNFVPFIKNEDIESDISLMQTKDENSAETFHNIKRENHENCRFQEIIKETTLEQSDQLVPSRDDVDIKPIIKDSEVRNPLLKEEGMVEVKRRTTKGKRRAIKRQFTKIKRHITKGENTTTKVINPINKRKHVDLLYDYENNSGFNNPINNTSDDASDDENFFYNMKKEENTSEIVNPFIDNENFSDSFDIVNPTVNNEFDLDARLQLGDSSETIGPFTKYKNFTGFRHQKIKQENDVSQILNPLYITSQNRNQFIKNEYPFIKDDDIDWNGFQDGVCVLVNNCNFNPNAYIFK
ncbi:1972_t:CDS:2 [Ambispora gerdemannii]|uniref:1972_t:CDS:1 n=1 Tax=Ambispora gerdemannii TaxID=144530 RepID=A0A9N8V2M5_9GLOM|nr:1972_t:CDS:2 [Ambispora gerdemannii]